MFTGFFIFLLSLGVVEVFLRGCPRLNFPRHGRVSCLRENARGHCGSWSPAGSVAEFTCEEFYRLSSEVLRFLECRSNGSWSSIAPKCVPDCGRRSEFRGLVVNGVESSLGDIPWHVGIYNLIDGNYEYWCGGSLISESIVITAAHCTWEISSSKLMLVFGKLHRDFSLFEKTAQKIKAKKIKIPDSYQDAAGHYNGDVAVVFLEHRVRLGHYSAPVCIDWDQRLTEKHLFVGTSGLTAGWGLTENDTLSDSLRTAMLPIVSDEKCIAEQEPSFKKFVRFTSFCAGLKNGTGVCNGDSGGGLAFFDKDSGRWYLHGLVSVSPRRKGTSFCDLDFYTVFTKVTVFSKWLERVIEVEKTEKKHSSGSKESAKYYEFFRKYFGKKITYPHTAKMLELADFSKAPRNAF